VLLILIIPCRSNILIMQASIIFMHNLFIAWDGNMQVEEGTSAGNGND
jgi:hypothetical protein